MAIKQPQFQFSAWEDYEDWESACSNCNWQGSLDSAKFEYETDLISSLHCPDCNKKIAMLENEANEEFIAKLAQEGSRKAKKFLESLSDS